MSNEQNVCLYYMLNNRISDFNYYSTKKIVSGSLRMSGFPISDFVAPLSVRIFALFYSVITWHTLCVLLP